MSDMRYDKTAQGLVLDIGLEAGNPAEEIIRKALQDVADYERARGRKVGLEEAQNVCLKKFNEFLDPPRLEDHAVGAKQCADAIKALTEKVTHGSKD